MSHDMKCALPGCGSVKWSIIHHGIGIWGGKNHHYFVSPAMDVAAGMAEDLRFRNMLGTPQSPLHASAELGVRTALVAANLLKPRAEEADSLLSQARALLIEMEREIGFDDEMQGDVSAFAERLDLFP